MEPVQRYPVFLPEPSLEPVYHYSPIILDPDSPDKRWVTLIQWHSHQDGTDKLSVSGRQLPDE